MKILTFIVHTDIQQELVALLRGLDQVSGYTLTHVEGHGTEIERDAFLQARDAVVGHMPRMRADILLEDSDVATVLTELKGLKERIEGRAIYWVTPVEQGGHL